MKRLQDIKMHFVSIFDFHGWGREKLFLLFGEDREYPVALITDIP